MLLGSTRRRAHSRWQQVLYACQVGIAASPCHLSCSGAAARVGVGVLFQQDSNPQKNIQSTKDTFTQLYMTNHDPSVPISLSQGSRCARHTDCSTRQHLCDQRRGHHEHLWDLFLLLHWHACSPPQPQAQDPLGYTYLMGVVAEGHCQATVSRQPHNCESAVSFDARPSLQVDISPIF